MLPVHECHGNKESVFVLHFKQSKLSLGTTLHLFKWRGECDQLSCCIFIYTIINVDMNHIIYTMTILKLKYDGAHRTRATGQPLPPLTQVMAFIVCFLLSGQAQVSLNQNLLIATRDHVSFPFPNSHVSSFVSQLSV